MALQRRGARPRRYFGFERLEDKAAPSAAVGLGSVFEAVHHHRGGAEHAGRAQDVVVHHQGQDDPAGHNANDDKGGHGHDGAGHH